MSDNAAGNAFFLQRFDTENGKGGAMEQSKEALLQKVLRGYSGYFNVKENIVLDGLPVAAEAEYHSRDEKYVLVKSAQIWAAENNEYAFFVLLDHLTEETLKSYYDAVLKEGMSRVKPEGDHMCSYVTLIVFADQVDPEAARAMKKLKYTKNFCFTLKGWAQFRGAALEVSSGKWCANHMGRDIEKSVLRMI